MNLFRIRGIQLAVHYSFFLLLAYLAYDGWQAEGWEGMGWSVALLLAFFTCIVLHELGHSFTAMRFGIRVPRILLMPIGGMAEFESIPREPSKELLMTIAGPAVNYVIAAILWIAVGVPYGWPFRADYLSNATGFFQVVLTWNLAMGLFNLLPAFPMDGGRILRALLATRLPYLTATRWAATIGKVVAVLGIAAALGAPEIGLSNHRLWLPAFLFTFIFGAGEMEYRAIQRREQAEAHWQATLARMYMPPPPPPAEEPPLLSR